MSRRRLLRAAEGSARAARSRSSLGIEPPGIPSSTSAGSRATSGASAAVDGARPASGRFRQGNDRVKVHLAIGVGAFHGRVSGVGQVHSRRPEYSRSTGKG